MLHEKVHILAKEYRDLQERIELPEVLSDHRECARIGKRLAELKPLMQLLDEYDRMQRVVKEVAIVRDDPELLSLAEEEAKVASRRIEEIEEETKRYLVPKNPDDDRNVILEIRAGTGGDEAALFAAELLRMYLRYAEAQRWKTDILSRAMAENGGIKEVICKIESTTTGTGAFGKLKYESGVHRVQRIPVTESKGRIHTSAASVAILPEAEEVDLEIRTQDLRIDVFRSSGPGGQSVNTTDSAVRITHVPTGMVVSCQDEKSQLKNKHKAMGILRSRLFALMREKQEKERGELRTGQIGTGDRSEKIRTYNFPQDRVTDHRVGKNYSNLPGIMEGDIDDIVQDLAEADKEERLSSV